MDSFVVFAKEPVAGRVKTRLSPAVPAADAVRLYTAFVEDVCATMAGVALGGDRRVLAAPGGAGPVLERIAKVHGFEMAEQIGDDLGARMAHSLGMELSRGSRAVVLVGSDSPTLPAEAVREGVRRLHVTLPGASSAVIGPAGDGGYWLIGAAGSVPDLFAGIPWSTRGVLSATLSRATQSGIDLALLPFWYDVDEIDDLKLLASHLRWATAQGRTVAPRTAAMLASIAPPGV